MKKSHSWLILALLFACQTPHKQNEVIKSSTSSTLIQVEEPENENAIGSESNPFNFYFTPSVSSSLIKKSADDMVSFLQKETGYHFNIVIPDHYDQVIEDFGNHNADLAIMNSFGYLLAHKKYDATARLRTIRYGKSTYQGQIIYNAENQIGNIEDLEGKRFAYTDSSSASGFLFPQQMLREKGVKLSDVIFLTNHDKVIEQVYLGEADAGATFYSAPGNNGDIRDARARLLRKYPDVTEKVKILVLTSPIPNDPVVFSKHITEEQINKLVFAIMKYSFTDDGKKILGQLYGTEGFARCSDKDYKNMTIVIENSGLDLNLLL